MKFSVAAIIFSGNRYMFQKRDNKEGIFYPGFCGLFGGENLKNEKPLKAVLKNKFIKKKNFSHFVKSKINTTKNGNIEVEILKGQESFRVQSFIKSDIWTLLPSGKSKFKKGEIVDCFFPHCPNKTF